MSKAIIENGRYERYHIETKHTEDIEVWPPRFDVKVGKIGLAKLLITELFQYGLENKEVIISRPCMYGVFSGPIGGFAPRPQHCVGCLRCTTEYPEFVQVSYNPERQQMGDSFFGSNFVDTISYEAEGGMIPVKGAGYRGKFGGEGWEGMWTDMSEIVRPTRDGIHGREFISTMVDIGYTPNFLVFDDQGKSIGPQPQVISIPLPILFDAPPQPVASETLWRIYTQAAEEVESLAILPLGPILEHNLESTHIAPLIKPGEQTALEMLSTSPELVEMDGWDVELYEYIRAAVPETLVSLRIPYSSAEVLLEYARKGIHIFHFLADFHGRGQNGEFVLDLIRQAHSTFVEAGIRQEVTLLGSGGIIAAEHVSKAILCGLDAVCLDTPLLVAMQGTFEGECADRETSRFSMPKDITVEWGVQRLMNLTASWRDQMLEISGAMGIREVRRMRGEMGRAMFMVDLEKEAFVGIEGYDGR
jgi:hypothetical protein